MSTQADNKLQPSYLDAVLKTFVADVKKAMSDVKQVKLRDDYEFNTIMVVPQSACASACLVVELEPVHRPSVAAALTEAGFEVLSSYFGFGSQPLQ